MEEAAQDDSRCCQYVKVYRFMGAELGLSGTELLVYARIFGFWTVGRPFYESRSSTAEFFGTTKRSVISAFRSLTERGLIEEVALPDGLEHFRTNAYAICSEKVERCCKQELLKQGKDVGSKSVDEIISPIGDSRSEISSPIASEKPSPQTVKIVHPIPKNENKDFR